MSQKNVKKIEQPEIGDLVAYYPRDVDASGDPRVAMVTEYGSKPGLFHLTIFWRPMADVMVQGMPPIGVANDIPFEPDMARLQAHEPYCADDSKLAAMPRQGDQAVTGPDDREKRIIEKHAARRTETVPPGGDGEED